MAQTEGPSLDRFDDDLLARLRGALTEASFDDAFLAECEVVVYAPGDDDGGRVDPELVKTARNLAKQIREAGAQS